MTNETIELRTTLLGLHIFLEIAGQAFTGGYSHNDDGRAFVAFAELMTERYPAGEPCDT